MLLKKYWKLWPHMSTKVGQYFFGTVPNHNLNQCWCIAHKTPRDIFQWNYIHNSNISFKKMHVKMSHLQDGSHDVLGIIFVLVMHYNVLINLLYRPMRGISWFDSVIQTAREIEIEKQDTGVMRIHDDRYKERDLGDKSKDRDPRAIFE